MAQKSCGIKELWYKRATELKSCGTKELWYKRAVGLNSCGTKMGLKRELWNFKAVVHVQKNCDERALND